ncbi:Sua5/YciO/YrdC/YwlC family protein [Candidatus Sororendozoicomonas aggregata]|uniref:Sua5/YciO/YrdC/YwlC family protein n=1 Tax=Candidatus Sororendozoicomonas aggregata TaxID=3073239 RepID=UPI002ED6A04D
MILDIDALNKVADTLAEGGVIAYPTEAVWGLGCDPWNEQAVSRLLNIKARPVEKGMILVGVSEEQFEPLLAPLTTEEREKLSSSWPGPVTWIVPDPKGWAPKWVRGRFDSAAIRVSDHPVIRYLCASLGKPMVSTSANLAGKAPLVSQQRVEETFLGSIDGIAKGETGARISPSEVRDLKTNKVFREG